MEAKEFALVNASIPFPPDTSLLGRIAPISLLLVYAKEKKKEPLLYKRCVFILALKECVKR